MFRRHHLILSSLLILTILLQVTPGTAQQIKIAPDAAGDGAAVDLARIQFANPATALLSWEVKIPSGVEAAGFDVRVEATLSDGKVQVQQRSFGGNARNGSFDFKLPSQAGGQIVPGGGKKETPGNGPTGPSAAELLCQSQCKTKASDPRKCIEQCSKEAAKNSVSKEKRSISTVPTKNDPSSGIGLGTTGPKPKPEAVRVTAFRATIVARFSSLSDLSAFREFIQPIDKITAELTPKSGRGSTVQVTKLIQISQLARFASECPANQDCFDIIAEARANSNAGQFKVGLEVIYPNGIRRSATRVATNLLRPIRIAVDRPAGVQLTSAQVNITGGIREEFSRKDAGALGILQGN